MTKKSISIRLPKKLYDKVTQKRNTNTYIIEKALNQYFRSKEPNQKLHTNRNTNVYNEELTKMMKEQIDFLKAQVTYLQTENSKLSGGFIYRMKNLLTSKKENQQKE